MFKVVEQGLGEIVWFGCSPTVSKLETLDFVITKFGADTNAQSELSNTGIIVPTAETAGKMVHRAVIEYCSRNMEEPSTKGLLASNQ